MELPFEQGTVLALGNFDGLHIGHMAVINSAKEMAEKLDATPCIVTFSEHPLSILSGKAPTELFTGIVKERVFEETGMFVCKLDFKSLMDMDPEEFFNKIVIEMLGAKGVCCGFNYSFGAGGKGTPNLMASLCKSHGLEFFSAPETKFEGEAVSSTRIRKEIASGNIELANKMLGRPFTYDQLVVDGDKRGRTFGTPTINQMYPTTLAEPRHGVYMSRCIIADKEYYSVTNIGIRPTIGNGPVSSETYILDFDGNLYGQYIQVSLLKFMRPEIKFDSLEELKNQIILDADTVRKEKLLYQN